MNIVIFGPPAAGKGTQADNIAKKFDLFKLSTGDLLREEIEKKTALGNKISTIINKGTLAPDEIMNELLEKRLSNNKQVKGIIFDGYPRNLSQTINLDKLLIKFDKKIDVAIRLKVSLEVIKKRISGRLVCFNCGKTYNVFFNPPKYDNDCCNIDSLKKRDDDNVDIAIKRFNTYESTTEPIFQFYRKLGLLRDVEGESSIEQISNEISGIISLIEG
tara:strand:+ start:480 stop:1130 length:651 start_codon:yes stop_codon:yes gene_type:complete